MGKIEVYEDGKPMPTERIELLGLKVTIIKSNDKIIIRSEKVLTMNQRDELVSACSRFTSGEVKFLLIPHDHHILMLRKED